MIKAPTWGIFAMVLEPFELLAAFAAHHLDIGAASVRLFFDKPDPALKARLEKIKGCTVTVCDQDFWDTHNEGARDELFIKRFFTVAEVAYRETDHDWLAFLDADEFIVPTGDFAAELANTPLAVHGLVFPPRERVFLPGQGGPGDSFLGGQFRRPTPDHPGLDPAYHGRAARFSRLGFSGHIVGKTITRVGLPITLGNHRPRQKRVNKQPIVLPWSTSAVHAHFDGLTPLHYGLKLLSYVDRMHLMKRRSLGAARADQINRLIRQDHRAEVALRLHDMVKRLDPDRAELLCGTGFVTPLPFDPVASVKKYLPKTKVDFSIAALDEQIRAGRPDLAEWLAAWDAAQGAGSVEEDGE